MTKEGSVYDYPLELGFKIATIGTRVRITDATGQLIAYVRKKKFRIKEDVGIYADEDQRKLLFRIKADRAWDFGAKYSISDSNGKVLGAVRREGCARSEEFLRPLGRHRERHRLHPRGEPDGQGTG